MKFGSVLPENTLFASADSGHIWIYTENKKIVLLNKSEKELTNAAILDSFISSAQAKNQSKPGLDWGSTGIHLYDTNLSDVTHVWKDKVELRSFLERTSIHSNLASEHSYAFILCTRFFPEFFDFFLDPSPCLTPTFLSLLLGDQLIISPIFFKDRCPTPRQWIQRLLENNEMLQTVYEARYNGIPNSDYCKSSPALALSIRTPRLATGFGQFTSIFNFATGHLSQEKFICLGECKTTHPPSDLLQDLYGPKTGLINQFDYKESRMTPLGEMAAVFGVKSSAQPKRMGGSSELFSSNLYNRAVSEALERECLEKVTRKTVRGSYHSLDVSIPLEYLNSYKDTQYFKDHFPFKRLEESTEMDWLEVTSVKDGGETHLPLALLSTDQRGSKTRISQVHSTGTAAGYSKSHAMEKALFELAERDIFVRSVLDQNLVPIEETEFEKNRIPPLLTPLVNRAHQNLKLLLTTCPSPFQLPIAVAWIQFGDELVYGSSAKPSFSEAMKSAWDEALQVFFTPAQDRLPIDDHIRKAFNASLETKRESLEARHRQFSQFNLNSLIEHYNPWTCELTSPQAFRVGINVMRVWSPFALPFLSPDTPLMEAVLERSSK